MKDSKYVIGIDLGTTNSAMAYGDTTVPSGEQRHVIFDIPQVVQAGEVESRPVLPSFTYLPGDHELPEGSLALPWDGGRAFAVGEFARDQGAKVPHRLVSSAKSWLCNGGVDRTDAILPWKSPDEVEKISPVEVSRRYLAHMKEAWDHHPEISGGSPFEDQEIVLTVPASFDAVARELTVKAATEAGFTCTLLEEPQAALYAWLSTMGDKWRKLLAVGDLIFVCDIGGGTTDFSLISVSEEGGDLVLERIAVGDHILLGGDNMDLALAMAVSNRLREDGTKLDSWQLKALCQSARTAKENMLRDMKMKKHQLVVPGRGSKLIGGSVKADLTRDELETVLIEGFFPQVASDDHPERGTRIGLTELGLPYEADAAVTKHIAKFLSVHQRSMARGRDDDGFVLPTAILFNGGVLKSPLICERIVKVIKSWASDESAGEIKVLEGTDRDLAVAVGASYYGMVKKGSGIRIRGGTARSYYIGIETSMPAVPGMRPPLKALCVAPQGMEEGTEAELPGREFGLVVGEPVEFRFLSSSQRNEDNVGTLVEEWDDELQELPALRVELPPEGVEHRVVPVTLRANVTEVGTLELWCVEGEDGRRWKLEFDVREKDE
ncbi:MAG: Hsp70 family protein [Candidatus Eremiobacteraeota bacterium]|nr:Hsp70 family protein [Candidatus Eremiobacteraeota bacterium]